MSLPRVSGRPGISVSSPVVALMAKGLGLADDFFVRSLTADPTPLFRIFRYPPHPEAADDRWGVGEHTDYGLLTLLAHDGKDGLEVKVGDQWVAVPSDTFNRGGNKTTQIAAGNTHSLGA